MKIAVLVNSHDEWKSVEDWRLSQKFKKARHAPTMDYPCWVGATNNWNYTAKDYEKFYLSKHIKCTFEQFKEATS